MSRRRGLFWIATGVFTLFLFVCLGELLLRVAFSARLSLRHEERNLTYRYDPILGWFPMRNSRKLFKGSREIHVAHNNRGFRDHEHGSKARPRIAFLGDSFVWGYDVEAEERFTELLQERLSEWEILNLGISGFGTDQEYLLIKDHFDFYEPDIVFLIFCTDNDRITNASNLTHGGYYKPYFVIEGGDLELRGVPVYRSINYYQVAYASLFRSYMFRAFAKSYFWIARDPHIQVPDPTKALLAGTRDFVEASGAAFAVGFQEREAELEAFCDASGIAQLDLSNSHRFEEQGNHWTPDGHAVVASRIHDFLVERDFLGRRPALQARAQASPGATRLRPCRLAVRTSSTTRMRPPGSASAGIAD